MEFRIRRDLRGPLVAGPLFVGIPAPTVLGGATWLESLQKSSRPPCQGPLASLKNHSF